MPRATGSLTLAVVLVTVLGVLSPAPGAGAGEPPTPPQVFVPDLTPVGSDASQVVVATGDADDDGCTDVLLADTWGSGPFLRIRHQQPDGSLGAPTVVRFTGNTPTDVVVGDVTGDGRSEIVIGCDQTIVTLSRGPDGAYTEASMSQRQGPSDLLLTDVDGDGTDDLVVHRSPRTWVLHGGPDGLGPAVRIPGWTGSDVVTVDFDHDGRGDLAGLEDGRVVALLADPDAPGGFGPEVGGPVLVDLPEGLTASGPSALAVEDFDGDGRLEAATTWNERNSVRRWITTLDWTGSGWGGPVHRRAGDAWVSEMVSSADMNGDGHPDLTARGPYRYVSVALWGSAGFGPWTRYPLPSLEGHLGLPIAGAQTEAVGDVNGDGEPDVVTFDVRSLWVLLHRPPNHPPVAEDALVRTRRGEAVALPLGASDPDGDPLVVAPGPGSPAHGTVTGPPGPSSYAPDPGFVGTDRVEFTVTDDWGAEALGAVTVTVDPVAPGPPVDLAATAGDGAVTLRWAPPVDDGGAPVTGYRVRRDGAEVASAAGGATSVTDPGLVDGSTYAYEVVAVGPGGDSAPATISVTPRRRTFPPAGYLDVRDGSSLGRAVDWATYHDVLGGGFARRFLPWAPATRGDTARAVWRLVGSPDVPIDSSFADVGRASRHRAAIDWLVAAQLVVDRPAGRFRPDAPMTRGQAISWLWQALGRPAVAEPHPYRDVPAHLDAALRWAHAHGIERGVTARSFVPGGWISRGALVQAAFRAAGRPGAWSAFPLVPPATARF